jgi:hypothetical protein
MSPTYDRGQRLVEADPKPLGQRIPNPLHERIEDLCDVVYHSGSARPTKVKMLAALILAAPADPNVLQEALRAYDAARVEDAVVATSRLSGNVISFPQRKSGPRTGRSS